MLSPLEISLVLAALLIGATGTFSPCGLSVIETIGPTGHTGGRPTTLAACATFLPGSVVGGLLTFGSLAALGSILHGAGGEVAVLVAAAIACLAALLEIRGTRIVPQIRRQLPEHWRRTMPMPLAAALYGVLLGIGFTTFVLSFGVWALAGISLALGEPEIGLLVGLGFGVGRAMPIILLAPLAGGGVGIRASELMCERPGLYLGLRRGDAAALLVVALALMLVPGTVDAAEDVASGTDPSATHDAVAFEGPDGRGVLRSGGVDIALSGNDPAIGGPYVAYLEEGKVQVLDRYTLNPVGRIEAPDADAIAISDRWLVYRAQLREGGDGMFVRGIAPRSGAPPPPPDDAGEPGESDPGPGLVTGPVQTLNTVGGPSRFSPPSLDGDTLLYGIATPTGSSIVQFTLGPGYIRTLVSSGRLLLFDPAVKGGWFVYTRTDTRRSQLLIRPRDRGGPGEVLLKVRRGNALVWSTALTEDSAYATLLSPGTEGGQARIVELPRSRGKQPRRRPPRGPGNHKF